MTTSTFHRLAGIALVAVSAAATGTVLAQTLRVVTEDTSYSYLVGDKVGGAATEAVEAVLQRAGLVDYRIALYPWARAYDMAQQQPNVLIYLIARTPEREALFKWVGELTRIKYHLYKLSDRDDVKVGDLGAAKNFSIGVMRDDVRHAYLQAEGFSRLVVSAHNGDNFRRLLNRQVDLVPMPEGDARQFCEDEGIAFETLEPVFTLDALANGLYMAFSRATSDEVAERAREAYRQLESEGVIARLMRD